MQTLRELMQALEKYNIEKDIAAYVKKEFDRKYNATWHCIVGRNFGTFSSMSMWTCSAPDACCVPPMAQQAC